MDGEVGANQGFKYVLEKATCSQDFKKSMTSKILFIWCYVSKLVV